HQAIQGRIDVSEAAGDGNRAGAVAADGEAGGTGERQHAAGLGHGDLHARAAGIYVGDGDGVAVGDRERQRAVLVHALRGRHAVHGQIGRASCGESDGVAVAARASGGGGGLGGGGGREVGGAVEVGGPL